MVKKNRTGPTADRFVDVTLSLIVERGGSQGVNLREVSRHVGCAHTNAYNYFTSFEDLLWTTLRRALRIYGEYMTRGLEEGLSQEEYFHQLITNLATFPQENPGLYRFIGSDPIDVERLPQDILETVSCMKHWLYEIFKLMCQSKADTEEAEKACNILIAYIDGETFNLINGRTLPGEDVRSRIVDNALRLFSLLTGSDGPGAELEGERHGRLSFPKLVLPETAYK